MVEIRFDALIDVDNYFLPNLNTLRRCRCEMPVLTHTLSGPCYLPLSVTARLSSPHLTYAAHSRTGNPAINSSYLPEPVATSYLHIFYRLPCVAPLSTPRNAPIEQSSEQWWSPWPLFNDGELISWWQGGSKAPKHQPQRGGRWFNYQDATNLDPWSLSRRYWVLLSTGLRIVWSCDSQPNGISRACWQILYLHVGSQCHHRA